MNTERMKEIQSKLGRLSREDFTSNKDLPYGESNRSGEYKEEVFWELYNALETLLKGA